jgi:hypothetical protein
VFAAGKLVDAKGALAGVASGALTPRLPVDYMFVFVSLCQDSLLLLLVVSERANTRVCIVQEWQWTSY